jgi:pyruvate kinase
MVEIAYNKTKIVATVGPASNSTEVLRQLIIAGVDVFRLNFSHGTHEVHKGVIEKIRALNKELGTHVAILQDLQGPKIRVEEVENNGVLLKAGEKLIITSENLIGNSQKVSTSYKALPIDVKIGDSILMDDGNLELKVIDKNDKEVIAEIVHGGILKSRKGINLPTSKVSAPSLTEKDYEDLLFGLEQDVDWIALSFVRTAKDIQSLRAIIEEKGKTAKIVAKLEKPEALENLDAIIDATDAVMVARGDLGVEIPMEKVPLVQKLMIAKCNEKSKPVIVATQMLESMITNPRPTRAEASDVANAVLDGADAVMLSAESASGSYPELAVKSMVRIIKSTEEGADSIYHKEYLSEEEGGLTNNDKVLEAAVNLAETTGATAITGLTFSGYSAFGIARHRPKADIFIFTENEKLLSQMSLIWGVRGFLYKKFADLDETIKDITQQLKASGHVKAGEIIVATARMPLDSNFRTNTIRMVQVS